jgi:hypothetical protein
VWAGGGGGAGGGSGTVSYDSKKAWPSINHLILSAPPHHTVKKEKKISLIYKKIQDGSGAKSYMRTNEHEHERSQMQGGKNWILPKEIKANRFF